MSSLPGQPRARIDARNVGVKYRIRYHRDRTLRETVIRWLRGDNRHAEKGSDNADFWALHDISLHVEAGEVIGVIGKNGAGKTTLLKTLAGICKPDRGGVQIQGNVGCVLSLGVGFIPTLSGRENIFLNGSILGLCRREIESRIDEIVDFSGLGDFIDAPVRTYSAGMKGRLGFAVAANIQPDILLLDEALSAGDAEFRAKAGAIVDRFSDDDKIVIITSHNIPIIEQLCTRVVWLERGRVQMEGEPAEVTRAYQQKYDRKAKPGQRRQAQSPAPAA